MSVSKDRMVQILGFLYLCRAEIVVEFKDEECYLFLGELSVPVFPEEVDCLVDKEIIELDGGTAEHIQESDGREVYCLTDTAHQRMDEILANKRALSLPP